jgi:hypothetical protein
MRLASLFSSAVIVIALSGCATSDDAPFTQGAVDDCSGVTVVVNYGILSEDRDQVCVEFESNQALAKDTFGLAGYEIAGTGAQGDKVVCRVNGLPSESEPFVVEGEEPYLETCADMPPGIAYWALWVKDSDTANWDYAQEGVGTLMLEAGTDVGLVFSTGGETPVPTDP